MGTGRKLLIVGDSFVAQDNDEHHEWAWWNRLAQDTKCEPINLAITGASNFNIWHQLKYGYKNYDVKNILVVLTAPNRIENINKQINEDISYEHFKRGDITSWAVHDRLAHNEMSIDIADNFFDYNVAVSKDKIIADSILVDALMRPCVILPNLFTEYTKYNFHILRDARPRDFSDVESGVLDEPQVGHIHKSWHERFYNEYSEKLLAKLD